MRRQSLTRRSNPPQHNKPTFTVCFCHSFPFAAPYPYELLPDRFACNLWLWCIHCGCQSIKHGNVRYQTYLHCLNFCLHVMTLPTLTFPRFNRSCLGEVKDNSQFSPDMAASTAETFISMPN